jgi:hypothetical protein
MTDYIKLALVGTAQGQEIVNIFYYAETNGDTTKALDPDIRLELAQYFDGTTLPSFVQQISNFYAATELQVSAVNELNQATSNYTVFFPSSESGAVSGDVDGVGQVGIIGFQVSYPFVGAAVGQRVPKKSYIAYGPLVSADVGNGGLIEWDGLVSDDIASALKDTITLSDSAWHPIRIGTNVDGVGALGWVENVIFRPYVRPRKSRMVRANGR